MYCECCFFPLFCLSWNIFIPNKPVFTQDVAWRCHFFPDVLVKEQLNSIIVNKLIRTISPEVYHSFDGNITCPIFVQQGWKLKYLQQLPGWGIMRGRSCIHTGTHIFHLCSAALKAVGPNDGNTLWERILALTNSAFWYVSFQWWGSWQLLKTCQNAGLWGQKTYKTMWKRNVITVQCGCFPIIITLK